MTSTSVAPKGADETAGSNPSRRNTSGKREPAKAPQTTTPTYGHAGGEPQTRGGDHAATAHGGAREHAVTRSPVSVHARDRGGRRGCARDHVPFPHGGADGHDELGQGVRGQSP